MWIANLDNLGATIDEALLGSFIESGAEVQVEVAPKAEGDRGGIPVWADSVDASGRALRRLQVLEEFRLPPGFDANTVRVFNTNTFLVRADALLDTKVVYAWFEVEKKVGGPGGRAVRAAAPGADGRDVRDVRSRPARGSGLAIPARQGLRRTRKAP